MTKQKPKIVIIGGGAAGFFCAANIKGEAEIIILEKSQKCLSKVKISGGGRCNVTHNCDSIALMSKKYPRGEQFLKKAFHHFFVPDTVDWFSSRGLKLKTEADNRMFPESDDSQSVIDVLWQAVRKNTTEVRYGQHVETVSKLGNYFDIKIKGQQNLKADFVVLATGGFPKLEQYNWLQSLSLAIIPPVPSLFSFNIPRHPITQLMGLSVANASVKILETKITEQGPLLITHWGLSGPAVLKTSAYGALKLAERNYDFSILVNFLAAYNEERFRAYLMTYKNEHPTQKLVNALGIGLPKRLWEFLLDYSQIQQEQKWADLPGKLMNKLAKNVTSMEFRVKGKTTFKEEFVTAGGIDLKEVDHNTMECKRMPQLYAVGELLNIDGVTGGFNFQNAWTSGWIAANAISKQL
jgi:predicted Rossmann fold flavoprotein